MPSIDMPPKNKNNRIYEWNFSSLLLMERLIAT